MPLRRDSRFRIPSKHGDGHTEDVYHDRRRQIRKSNGIFAQLFPFIEGVC